MTEEGRGGWGGEGEGGKGESGEGESGEGEGGEGEKRVILLAVWISILFLI